MFMLCIVQNVSLLIRHMCKMHHIVSFGMKTMAYRLVRDSFRALDQLVYSGNIDYLNKTYLVKTFQIQFRTLCCRCSCTLLVTGCQWGYLPSWWGWVCSLDPVCLSGRRESRSISILLSPGRRCGRSALQLHPGGGWTEWWCGLGGHTHIHMCIICTYCLIYNSNENYRDCLINPVNLSYVRNTGFGHTAANTCTFTPPKHPDRIQGQSQTLSVCLMRTAVVGESGK